MKKILIIALAIISFSCSKVLFQVPQPEKVDRTFKIPQELWGFYTSKNDTLLISEFIIQFRTSIELVDKLNFDIRNNEVILKHLEDSYYLNVKVDEEGLDAWQLARLQKKGKELEVRFIESLDSMDLNFNAKDSADFFSNYQIIGEGDDKRYLLKPNNFELIDKLFDKSKKEIFKKN